LSKYLKYSFSLNGQSLENSLNRRKAARRGYAWIWN